MLCLFEGEHPHYYTKQMTNELLDQELSNEDLKVVNGGNFGSHNEWPILPTKTGIAVERAVPVLL